MYQGLQSDYKAPKQSTGYATIRTEIETRVRVTHFTADGVPLKKITTNNSTFASFGMNPPSTIVCTMARTITGKMASFTAHTDKMAGMGRRDIGRGIRRRANDAPRSINAIGTAIFPMNLASSTRLTLPQARDCTMDDTNRCQV
jgi:hypothetical protein